CYSAAKVIGKTKGAFAGDPGPNLTTTNCYSTAKDGDGNYLNLVGMNSVTNASTNTYSAGDATNDNIHMDIDRMTGGKAVTNMEGFFSDDTWYVMTGETPKLLSFTGLTSIQTGDLNLDDEVNILDLVKLAQWGDSGAVINESNKVIIDGISAENSKAALKRILLG
ncbi:MAG: hypothetical protein UHO61_00945, partial [Acutalibacteraceae bacterium]|nr:hypothetical protein [Acutalibacteraceae bacterium]